MCLLSVRMGICVCVCVCACVCVIMCVNKIPQYWATRALSQHILQLFTHTYICVHTHTQTLTGISTKTHHKQPKKL